MPAIESTARNLTSAAEVLQNFQDTRSRLRSGTPAPVKLPPQIAAPPEPIIPASAPRTRVEEIFEIVDAVASEIGTTRDQLMSDATLDSLSTARKVAIAVIVLRLDLSPQVVTDHFGVLQEVGRESLATVREIFVKSALSRTAPLAESIRRVFEQWPNGGLGAHRPSINEIKRAVCEEFKISRVEIESELRVKAVCRARQIGMTLARRFTGRSLAYIGGQFGGRDHTTVLCAMKRVAPVLEKIAPSMALNATIVEWVAAVAAEIGVRR